MLLTSFSAKGYEEYGRRLLQGMAVHMPGTPLMVYSEDKLAISAPHPITALFNLQLVPAYVNFLDRHGGSLLLSGRVPGPGWKTGDREKGYCYKFDALKFCRKVFAIADAARNLGHGSLTWMDADAYPISPPPPDFFDSLSSADVTFLGRHNTHSECGFIHFRLPQAMPLIGAWENFYASDRFLGEREYHDSFLFDQARKEVPSVTSESISKPGTHGHVWVYSPLGRYWDHTKGKRKELGFSPERRGLGA